MDNNHIDPALASLCLSILDGEQNLNLIVADRFEEMGSAKTEVFRELQSRFSLNGCRFTHKIAQPLDLVIHALPESICWSLICDFATHVLPIWEAQFPMDKSPHLAIAASQSWIEGKTTREELEKVRVAAFEATRTAPENAMLAGRTGLCRGGEDARAAVRAAARTAQRAAGAAAYELAIFIQQKNVTQGDQLRFERLIEFARSAGLSFNRKDFKKVFVVAKENECKWQLNRLRQYLNGEFC